MGIRPINYFVTLIIVTSVTVLGKLPYVSPSTSLQGAGSSSPFPDLLGSTHDQVDIYMTTCSSFPGSNHGLWLGQSGHFDSYPERTL
jgi:hypothetical protein